MKSFDFFMLALNIYARNDLQAILKNAGIIISVVLLCGYFRL